MVTLDMLEPFFREVFDDDTISLRRETTSNDIDAWDSLTHMNLVMVIETNFKVRFALGELHQLRNVGDMLNLINKKQAK